MKTRFDPIRVGNVTLPYRLDYGWVLPGMRYTKNPFKAQRIAEMMNEAQRARPNKC